jgi:hypothetical protein
MLPSTPMKISQNNNLVFLGKLALGNLDARKKRLMPHATFEFDSGDIRRDFICVSCMQHESL